MKCCAGVGNLAAGARAGLASHLRGEDPMGMRMSILVLLLSACAPGIDTVEQEIVNGSISADGDHPATVYLWLGNGSCSGTLVSPHVVLTAKHCVEGVAVGSIEVFFGNDVNATGTWINAADYEYHATGDIAVIAMAEVGPTAPMPISSTTLTNSHIGMEVLLVGFGDTGGAGSAGIKREGTTNIESLGGDIMYVGSSGAKTCFGDSGGPTFVDWDSVRHVAGVSSFITDENCNYGNSGNVRTDVYYGWIMAYVDQNDPASCAADGRCATGCSGVDPDCPCADDGFCTSQCADWLNDDPDCGQCGSGDTCATECPELDLDCCVEDDNCHPACGSVDPDCAPVAPDAGPDDPGADIGNNLTGGCSTGGGSGAPLVIVLSLAFGAVLGRRKRRSV